MRGRRAVFLDRDGVLNAVVRRDGAISSPRRVEEFVIEDGVVEAVGRLHAAGLPLFVVTNQPDIARGLLDAAALAAMHARLGAALPLREIVHCPHDNAADCACRKPRPGMILDLAARHGLDPGAGFMVGDQDRDMACGQAAGCTTVQLARPYNSGAGADHRVATLADACDAILAAIGLHSVLVGPR